MTPRLVFDVSGVQWRADRLPSGIPRVQLAVASRLASNWPDTEFCEWDAGKGCFVTVETSRVLDTVHRSRSEVDDPPSDVPAPSRAAQHARLSAYHAKRAVREVARSVRARAQRAPVGGPARGASSGWSSDTTYCTVSASWRHGGLAPLGTRGTRPFRALLTVHDVIPVLAPQYTDLELDEHFCALLDTADALLVGSRATERDLAAFAARHGRVLPRIERLPIGSDLVDQEACIPRSFGGDVPAAGSFVLCAGSVELRKNQALLLDVWEMLVATHPHSDIPPLVVAGNAGQLSQETISRLTRTASLRDVVTYVPSPTDGELAWLFRNCAFTVFPSRYEGWGLPVAESLDFGKLCLTGDGSSLPEVGEGLTELLDPFDRTQWRDRIVRYWTSPRELRSRERDIAQQHRRTTIDDTTRAVVEIAGSARS